jgi:hypothetical protein
MEGVAMTYDILDRFDRESWEQTQRLRKVVLVAEAAQEFIAQSIPRITTSTSALSSLVVDTSSVAWFVLKRRVEELP